ncbi:uncharacterized protein BDZ99DRAFT_464468 [Mytilinidion resinicola]|uniref:Glutaredoxin domain-containing protein n=1 Tax=Mytilinidion resinicola TaxID=574789 RepID=A0A6A6YIE7_9PEZI|nr:uncharacterized protein BDZ99DRAFT_464468 [Mytilinidion resinicola]KAF2808622.1 hypothetical protein BDZ99DRAFT_464468 [Mytilinidion resinicola]
MELAVFDTDPTLYLFTSLTAGSSHIVTATSRIETILKANNIPFTYKDTATDDLARKLFQRRAMGKKLPMLVQGGYVIADLEEVEEWNEYGELHDNIKVVAAAPMTTKPVPGASSAPTPTAQAPAKQENKDPAAALAMRTLSAEAAAKGAAKKPIPINIATTNPLMTEKVNTPTTPSKAAAASGILSPKSVPLPATPTAGATKKEAVKDTEKADTSKSAETKGAVPAPEKKDTSKSAEKKETAKSAVKKNTAKSAVKKNTTKSAVRKVAARSVVKKTAAKPVEKKATAKSAQKKDTTKSAEKKEEKPGDSEKAIPGLAKPGDNKYKSDAPPKEIATGGVPEAPVAVLQHRGSNVGEASQEEIKAIEDSQAIKEEDDEDEESEDEESEEDSEEEESEEEESSEDETDEEAGDPGPDVMSTLSPLYRRPKPEHLEEKVVTPIKKEESSKKESSEEESSEEDEDGEDDADEDDEDDDDDDSSEEDESEEEAPTASKAPAAKKPESSAKAGEKSVVSAKANEKVSQEKESKTQAQSAKAGDKAGVSVED